MKYRYIIFLFSLLAFVRGYSQEDAKKFQVNGYLSNLQSYVFQDISSDWIGENTIHNRINMNYYATPYLNFNLEIRNRFITGDNVRLILSYAKMFEHDKGYFELTTNIFDEKSFFLNSTIDRAKIDFTLDKLNITIGRQRINWGQTFVWNPNDLFNNYSFFDVDYEERPGSDAIRLQYYNSTISSVELVAKSDSSNNLAFAGMFRFNSFNYDFQVLAGKLNNNEYAAGVGWSGFIKSFGFRGEITQLIPANNTVKGLTLASVAVDYSFANSAMLQLEGLFIDKPLEPTNFTDYYTNNLSIRNLSFTKLSLFCSGSYPITPILSISLSGMYYPKLNGYFVGPSATYSLSDNATFSLFIQSFGGEFNNKKETFNLAFLRLKYNF